MCNPVALGPADGGDKLSDSYVRKPLRVHVTEAARKHGVTDDRIRFVIRHCGLALEEPPPDDPTEPNRLLFLGDDDRGVALEILTVDDARGGLVVIHAMRLRRRYRRQYEEALQWRKVP